MLSKQACRYFARAWKHRLTVARVDGALIVTDGFCAFATDDDDPLFDSRRMFPVLPEEGKALAYCEDAPPVEKSSLVDLWQGYQKCDVGLKFTKWLYCSQGVQRRVFRRGEVRVCVNHDTLSLVITDDWEVESKYQYKTTAKDDDAVAVFTVGSEPMLVAVIMPMLVEIEGMP